MSRSNLQQVLPVPANFRVEQDCFVCGRRPRVWVKHPFADVMVKSPNCIEHTHIPTIAEQVLQKGISDFYPKGV